MVDIKAINASPWESDSQDRDSPGPSISLTPSRAGIRSPRLDTASQKCACICQNSSTAKGQLSSRWENGIPGQAGSAGMSPRPRCVSRPRARLGGINLSGAFLELLQGSMNSRNIKGWERAPGVGEFGELNDYLALINPLFRGGYWPD